MASISRHNYPLREKFPPISQFPDYNPSTGNVAIVSRLFSPGGIDKWRYWFDLALWSMRSHILNSDMQTHNASFFFHIVESHYEEFYKEAFQKCNVPQRAILVYPDDMVKLAGPEYILGYAVSPFLDERLDTYEHIIVMDADMFSLQSSSGEPFPLIEMSLNDFPHNEIGLERSWVEQDDPDDAIKWFKNWVVHSPHDENGWIERAAEYCGTTPRRLGTLLRTSNWDGWKGFAGHCGAYIRIPVQIYQRVPEFRSFVKRASAELGNEEMALGVWYIKHYLKTGEMLPETDFPSVCAARNCHVFWHSEHCQATRDRPRQWHIYIYDSIDDDIYQLAQDVGASDEERDILSETVISDVRGLRNKTSDTHN